MPEVIAIGGSPSLYSKSAALLGHTRNFLETQGLSTELIQVRDLPAEALLFAQFDNR
jgi:FMN reductase